MLDKDILSEAMEREGINQSELAKRLDVNRSSVSTTLHRDNMGVDVFVKYMNVIGYSVYAGKEEDGRFIPEWEVTPGNADKRVQRFKGSKAN